MAKRSKTNDDTQLNRPAPVLDGMSGGLLSGAVLAAAVAGAVEHSLTARSAVADSAGVAQPIDTAEGGEHPSQASPAPAPHAGPDARPGSEWVQAPDEAASTSIGAEPSPLTGSGTAGAPSPSGADAAAAGYGESAAARPDTSAATDAGATDAGATDAGAKAALAPAAPMTSTAEPATTTPLTDLVPDLAALPADLSTIADRLAGDVAQDVTALTQAVAAEFGSLIAMPAATTAELGSALQAPAQMVADLGAARDTPLASLPTAAELVPALVAPVAQVAALAETVTAIPATLLGAEDLDAPLSPLSIALGAEANTAPHLSVTLPGVEAEFGVDIAAGVDVSLLEFGGLDGGGASAMGFAGVSYLDMPEIDGGTTGGSAGILHGFI